MTVSHDKASNTLIVTCDNEEMLCIWDSMLPIDTDRAERGRAISEVIDEELAIIEEATGKVSAVRVIEANDPLSGDPAAQQSTPRAHE